MANDYDRDDLFRMQQDAMRRVQEMQNRARRTVEESNKYGIPFDEPEPEPRSRKSEPVPPPKAPPKAPKPEPHPSDFRQKPSPTPNFLDFLTSPPGEGKEFSGINIAGINLTGDHILIIMLLFLLYTEDADKLLMLALLYIMF